MGVMNFDGYVEALIGDHPPAKARPLPADIEHARLERGSQVTTLRTRVVDLPDRGELRSVVIDGPKVDIITIFVWPDPARDAPTYAMELVAFAGKPVVAVVDAVGLASSESESCARKVLEAARGQYPGLQNADDPPQWYSECRSGHDFFLRPPDVDGLRVAGDIASLVLRNALAAQAAAPSLDPTQREAHEQAQSAYKGHHRDNTPGLAFLQRGFGDAWTDRFLHEHVFA